MKRTIIFIVTILGILSCSKFPTYVSGGTTGGDEKEEGVTFSASVSVTDGYLGTDASAAVEPEGSILITAEDPNTIFSVLYSVDDSQKYRLSAVRPGQRKSFSEGLSGLAYGSHVLRVDVTCSETGERLNVEKSFVIRELAVSGLEVKVTDEKGKARRLSDKGLILYRGETVTLNASVNPPSANTRVSLVTDSSILMTKKGDSPAGGEAVYYIFAKDEGAAKIFLTADNGLDAPFDMTIPVAVLQPAPDIQLDIVRLDNGEPCPDGSDFVAEVPSSVPVGVIASPSSSAIDGVSLHSSDESIIGIEKGSGDGNAFVMKLNSYGTATVTASAYLNDAYVESSFLFTVSASELKVRATYETSTGISTLEFINVSKPFDIDIHAWINTNQNHPQVVYYSASYKEDGSRPSSEAECKSYSLKVTEKKPLSSLVTIPKSSFRITKENSTVQISSDYLSEKIRLILQGESPYERKKNQYWEWTGASAVIRDYDMEDSSYSLPAFTGFRVFYMITTESLSATPVVKTEDSNNFFVFIKG